MRGSSLKKMGSSSLPETTGTFPKIFGGGGGREQGGGGGGGGGGGEKAERNLQLAHDELH